MKKIINSTLTLSMAVALASCGSTATQDNTVNKTEATTTEQAESAVIEPTPTKGIASPATHSDDKLSFQYPRHWELFVNDGGDKTYYTLQVNDEQKNSLFAYSFEVQPADEYQLRQDKAGLEDIFNNPVGAISRSEFVTTKSGEKAYYMESQADDLSRISMFLPVGDTQAKNTVIGGAVDVNEHIHQIAKDGVFIEILKSIEFKVK